MLLAVQNSFTPKRNLRTLGIDAGILKRHKKKKKKKMVDPYGGKRYTVIASAASSFSSSQLLRSPLFIAHFAWLNLLPDSFPRN